MVKRESITTNNSSKYPFLWGVATSAFHIEGHLRNDISDWEKQGHFNQNGKAPAYGWAANHWKLWKKDFQLLKQLNVNAYRFSMDWGRIRPERGQFDEAALGQYDRTTDELLELDIIPMLTLHHFTQTQQTGIGETKYCKYQK